MKNKLKNIFFLIVISCVFCTAGCQSIKSDTSDSIIIKETDIDLSVNKNDVTSVETCVEPSKDVQQETPKQEQPENTAEELIKKHKKEEKSEESKTTQNICTLSVQCKIILSNMDKLKSEKRNCVPVDGVILAEKTVEFNPGETVFDVLLRVMQQNKIHMEFTETPLYKSMYIKGINNLYEFDCGELSGWLYTVNGEILGVGCSQAVLNPGDVVEWIYTCNLGGDIEQISK